MKFPGIPENEEERLKSLHLVDLLDTGADERFDRLTRLAKKVFQVPVVLISLLDRERQWLLACEGLGIKETPRNISFCGHAILQEGPFIVNDAANDERFHDNPLVTGEPYIRFYAGYPVHLPDGQVAGTLCLINTTPRGFNDDDIASLKDLAFILEDEFRVIGMAMTDSLTGIANRRGFYRTGEKRFRNLAKDNAAFSLIFFDLDRFKPINDLWGHAEGDEVLKVFSALLHQHLGAGDIVGRLGGDEFAVLVTQQAHADAFLNNLRKSVDEYNKKSGKPYNINYSFGMLHSDARRYQSLGEMLKESDEVMYSAKRRKRI
ncbi:sensor domain-containing diguanylate cyclase [Salmonella enterica]|nr:sensor domain-containing diguanylate cyclase [Salmonella enterica subsp. enterica serovar Idikan]EBS9243169.1 sensor domain-containing diguanylate cyclase [Salmonella enterica]ECE0997296.1 sensor domain-containing diguanylate cyclase [Salmonella enterica subsp. enterica serovar Bere]EDT7270586.1 sensor domain-containing diguanylate cyclase [Salmonella enterica subsp. enterica serovar Bere]EHS0746677.1 sensor domain-containing diguanylate cyclase [Salmonella enterica]